MATRKDQKVNIGRKSKQDIPRPVPEGLLRNERTVKEVARAVMRRRSKALRALAGAPVTAMLIAERSERDDELADQFARLVATQRRLAAHDENDPGSERSEKRVRVTVTLEEDLITLAQTFTGIKEMSALIRLALSELVDLEMDNRLTALGRTEPDSKRVLRRRLPGK